MQTDKTFLVVDDSYIDRLVSATLIRRTFGATDVQEVAGGKQALEWLAANGMQLKSALVIVLDIMMPKMSGFEFLECFDRMEPDLRERTSIIMLSSTLDHEDIERAMKHVSVKKLLSKPLSINELKDFI